MSKVQETVLEINLKALKHNFELLRSRVKPSTKVMAVVKAFAYGSDPCQVTKYLQNLNIDYFAVAYVCEGVTLRNSGITKPILVLHPQSANFNQLIEMDLEPCLYSTNVLRTFIRIATKKQLSQYPVHIKINTGLNRLGFSKMETPTVITSLKQTDTLKVASVFSHLAASEDMGEEPFTRQQIKTFTEIANTLKAGLGYHPLLHLCNTSGTLNYPEAHFDMVRSGIGLYGYGNTPIENKFFKPISTLKTVISQIHTIPKGASVGYNRSYISPAPQRIATLPLGHADGISRQYGNGNGYVYINGCKALTVGNVCMDMMMVNVTDIKCEEGDTVIVFGEKHSASALAEAVGTISYELLTAISQRIKRRYIE